jgi:Putative beta-barrel porin-2, OmpL-like. bbp2
MRFHFLVFSAIIWLLFTGTGFAQSFTGTLDGYWSYNTNTPAFQLNSFRAFDIHDQAFSMNYGELAVAYKPKDVGFRVDVGFGDAADIVLRNTGDSQTWRHIQQAYITGTHGKFTVDFGKWVTPIGAEVIETKDNWNYTRGFLFTFAAPFYHFGARGTYIAGSKATLSGYVVNGWNNVRENNDTKSVGIEGVFTPVEKVSVTTNVLIGRENLVAFGIPSTGDGYRQLFDGVLTYKPTQRASLMANYNYTRDKAMGPGVFWQGIAAYGKLKANERVTFASRYEWFGDNHNAFRTGINQNLQSFTATAQFPWSDLTLWAEYRRDWSTEAIFNKTQGTEDSSVLDNQNTITFGLTYVFQTAR